MIRTAIRIIMGIGAACLLSAQTEEGLLAYWSFDEAEGQTAKDAGPWKMDGAVKNAVRVEGKKARRSSSTARTLSSIWAIRSRSIS